MRLTVPVATPGARLSAVVRALLAAALVLPLASLPAGAFGETGPASVAPLAKRLSDAVVNIATSQRVEALSPQFAIHAGRVRCVEHRIAF